MSCPRSPELSIAVAIAMTLPYQLDSGYHAWDARARQRAKRVMVVMAAPGLRATRGRWLALVDGPVSPCQWPARRHVASGASELEAGNEGDVPMDMSGERQIAASRTAVWAALNDPEILRQCIPGCESLEKQSATEMTARVKLQIGPVRATFNGKVRLSDLDPPNRYR